MKNKALFSIRTNRIVSGSPIPLYRQVEDLVLQEIAAGKLKEGDLLPSEIEIAKVYGVHQGTVRKAILNLTLNGILYRKQGQGTFVVFQQNNLKRYKNYRFTADESGKFERANIVLLDLDVVRAGSQEAVQLQVKKGTKLIRLERFGNIGHNSYLHTVSLLPKKLYSGLEKFTAEDFVKNTLWKLQEILFKIRITKREEFITTTVADEKLAERLDTQIGAPILQINMKASTETGEICEYRVSHCKLDGLSFYISYK
jgi:GntR family transcriptional regulator